MTLKNGGVTEQRFAKISERLGELRGIDVDSDWVREYPMGEYVEDNPWNSIVWGFPLMGRNLQRKATAQ